MFSMHFKDFSILSYRKDQRPPFAVIAHESIKLYIKSLLPFLLSNCIIKKASDHLEWKRLPWLKQNDIEFKGQGDL